MYSETKRGTEDFYAFEYREMMMWKTKGAGGSWMKKRFFSVSRWVRVGYTSTKVERSRSRRVFKVPTKISTYSLWYYHASNGPGGLSSGEKKEEKKRQIFSRSLGHGRKSGRSPAATWSIPVQVHGTHSRCKPAGVSGQLEGVVKVDRCSLYHLSYQPTK